MKDRRPEVPVRMVAFPGANHGVSRDGLLHHQITHMAEMCGWFQPSLAEGGVSHDENTV
jgi:dipeptidyl aminopeptidase/acylaminoacyl peptidase